jgi:hypothetical protein
VRGPRRVHARGRRRDRDALRAAAEPDAGDVHLPAPGRQRRGAGAGLRHQLPDVRAHPLRTPRRGGAVIDRRLKSFSAAGARPAGGLLLEATTPPAPATTSDGRRTGAGPPTGSTGSTASGGRCGSRSGRRCFCARRRSPTCCPGRTTIRRRRCSCSRTGAAWRALFELDPIPTEAATEASLEELSDTIRNVIAEAIPEDDGSPWVLHCSARTMPTCATYLDELRAYAAERVPDNPLTEDFLQMMGRISRGSGARRGCSSTPPSPAPAGTRGAGACAR